MTAARRVPVLTAPERFEEQPYTPPRPQAGEVLVDVDRCGVCGSDIHAYRGEHPFMPPPLILGHEFSARIAALGEGVTGLAPGQRVTVEPLLSCGRCTNCRGGRYNVCLHRKVIGCQSTGAYSGRFTVPAARVIPLPDAVSDDEGAMVEPLAVAVHAARRAQIRKGEGALVFGAGPIGLLTAKVIQAYGCDPVGIVDRIPERLALADRLGLPLSIDLDGGDLGTAVRGAFGADGPDLLVDCVGGKGGAFSLCLKLARPGTRILAVGIFEPVCTVPDIANLVENELDVIGTSVYRREDFEEAVALIAAGAVDVNPLITHRYPLSEVASAYALTGEDRPAFVKIMLDVRS